MPILVNLEDELHRLIRAAGDAGIILRALGGLAIKNHCMSANLPALQRTYADMDLATDREGGKKLTAFLEAQGYLPDKSFNTLNGGCRQLYYDKSNRRQVDIFVNQFEMCHRIPLNGRLSVEPLTLPLAELFLTKIQIIELNPKDCLDLFTLLLDHPTGNTDNETINTAIIAGLCAQEWGLYTTVEINIKRLAVQMTNGNFGLTDDQKKLITNRLQSIQAANEAAPKNLKWKTRARVGKKVRWYLEVEEVER